MYSPYPRSKYYNGASPGVHGVSSGTGGSRGKPQMETTLLDDYEELFSPGGTGGTVPRVPGGAVAMVDESRYEKNRRMGDMAVVEMGVTPYHDKPANMIKHAQASPAADLYADDSSSYQIMPRRHPKEPFKTVVAGLYMFVCMVCTAVALALVHEVRPKTGPLPDQFLDRVVYQRWGLSACEHLIQLQTVAAAMVLVFHKHRFIVVRRVFLMIGTLYLYRALTMWVTALPLADPTYTCAPTYNETHPNETIPSSEVANRAFKIITGFGLSINGQHVYCGDYIFSGHTMSILMGHLIVRECKWTQFDINSSILFVSKKDVFSAFSGLCALYPSTFFLKRLFF